VRGGRGAGFCVRELSLDVRDLGQEEEDMQAITSVITA